MGAPVFGGWPVGAVPGAFGGFESPLMILMAALGQAFMLHSCDLVTFYGCSELQNFGFLVLCALQPGRESSGFSVEASLKISLLSAFSSGVCLFLFSVIYARTGQSVLLDAGVSAFEAGADSLSTLGVLLALLFKHGTAPMHLWMVDIYQSIKKPLLMILSTAPKLSMFCFWVSALHNIWTDASIGVFVCFSMILGSLGAYGQPALRSLFAYSTINEIGLMLLALAFEVVSSFVRGGVRGFGRRHERGASTPPTLAMVLLLTDVVLKVWVGAEQVSGVVPFVTWGVKTSPAGSGSRRWCF